MIADGAPETVFRDQETMAARTSPARNAHGRDLLRARGLLPASGVCPRTAAEAALLGQPG